MALTRDRTWTSPVPGSSSGSSRRETWCFPSNQRLSRVIRPSRRELRASEHHGFHETFLELGLPAQLNVLYVAGGALGFPPGVAGEEHHDGAAQGRVSHHLD